MTKEVVEQLKAEPAAPCRSIDRQERLLDPAKMTENAEKAAETVSTAVSDVTVRVSTEARKRWRKAGMMAKRRHGTTAGRWERVSHEA